MTLTKIVKAIAVAMSCLTLASCGEASGPHHWKKITELTGTSLELYFVTVDPGSMRDRKVYEDAAETLCRTDICEIGFFSTRNDVPTETLTADFFANGGWKDRHETAHFFHNSNSGLKRLAWDCNVFPQDYLNDCLSPSKPSVAVVDAAKRRGALTGFGKVKFGMSLDRTIAALGGHDAVTVLDPQGDRTIVRTKTQFHDRAFNAFYNVVPAGFSMVLMKWSDSLSEDACTAQAKQVAGYLEQDYGKEDHFGYYDAGGSTFEYSWLFANGATIRLDNLSIQERDCSLDLSIEPPA